MSKAPYFSMLKSGKIDPVSIDQVQISPVQNLLNCL